MQHTYLASAHPLFGLHILPSPIMPSARCDSGAKSPLAPTVPFSGTHGRQLAVAKTNVSGKEKNEKQVKKHLKILSYQNQIVVFVCHLNFFISIVSCTITNTFGYH